MGEYLHPTSEGVRETLCETARYSICGLLLFATIAPLGCGRSNVRPDARAALDAAFDAETHDASSGEGGADAQDVSRPCALDGASPAACGSLVPEGTSTDAAGLFYAIETAAGPAWLRDNDLSVRGGPYSVVRPRPDFESFDAVASVAGLPLTIDGESYGLIADASAYAAACDRWLFLVQDAGLSSDKTYAVVYGADGRAISEPRLLSPARSNGPVTVTRNGFSVFSRTNVDPSPGCDVTAQRVDISFDGELLETTASITAPIVDIVSWNEARRILATIDATCPVPMLRGLTLWDLAENGSLTGGRSTSALGEDGVTRWRWILRPTGPGLVLYESPSEPIIRVQRFDVRTGMPLAEPFTIFHASSGSGPSLGLSLGSEEPGVGYLWPVIEASSTAATAWLVRFSYDGVSISQQILGTGVPATPADASVTWVADRYVAQWFLGTHELDELSCLD